MSHLIKILCLCFIPILAFAGVSDGELQKYIESGNRSALVGALESGIDVNHKIGKQQLPLIHIAVINGKDNIVRELIKRGADPNTRDAAGKTALHHAAIGKKSNWVINYLASKGGDPGIQDAAGKYPLDLAKEAGNQRNVMALSVVGMTANQKGGHAPTDMTAEQKNAMLEMMQGLQQQGTKNMPKKTEGLSRKELAGMLEGTWVNTKTNHIVTFHKNGRYEGPLLGNVYKNKSRFRWSAGSGSRIKFSEVKLSGFGGFSKSVDVELNGDNLVFAKSDFVEGEYTRASEALIAQARTNKEKQQKHLAESLKRDEDLKKQAVTSRNIPPRQGNLGFIWASGPGSNFSGGNWRSEIFNWSDLQNSSFANSYFDNSSFFRADLRNADFSSAKINDTSFANANLEGANFRNAVINRALFTGANLKNADFTGAQIVFTDFSFTKQDGMKFNANIDSTVKVQATKADKQIAGLWVNTTGGQDYGYTHIFNDGTYFTVGKRVNGKENYISIKGNAFYVHNSKDLYNSRGISGYLAVDGARFEVNDATFRIFGVNGKVTEYHRANENDWDLYKETLYRNAMTDLAKRKQIIVFEKLFASGVTVDEMRNHRVPRLWQLILLDASDYEKQCATAYLMKMMVEQGMDYQNHLRSGRTPLAEAAVLGQLEALKYMLTVDRRHGVIEAALRDKAKFANQQAVAILEAAGNN